MRMEGNWGPPPPPLPTEGHVLVSRMPMSDVIRITWPDGEFRTIVYDRQGDIKLIRLGLIAERLPKLLNYVYNFYHAYTVVVPGSRWAQALADERVKVWLACVAAIRRWPLMGLGLGSFWPAIGMGFHEVRCPGRWMQAHNEPLQVAAESGLPAAACLVAGAFWLLVRSIASGAAVTAAALAVGMAFSLTYFPFRTPTLLPWVAWTLARAAEGI